MNSAQQTFVQVDPNTGLHIGPATAAEIAAYLSQPTHLANLAWGCFRKPILVGAVLIDEDTGPGRSHTPGRFVGGAS